MIYCKSSLSQCSIVWNIIIITINHCHVALFWDLLLWQCKESQSMWFLPRINRLDHVIMIASNHFLLSLSFTGNMIYYKSSFVICHPNLRINTTINYDQYDISVTNISDVSEVPHMVCNIHFTYYTLNHVDI